MLNNYNPASSLQGSGSSGGQVQPPMTNGQTSTIKDIYLNLSEKNGDVVVDPQGNISIYKIKERSGNPIPLANLPAIIETHYKLDVSFQRESDDHSGKTPQEIVADFLTGHQVGYVSCYQDPTLQKKVVIDGRHRLTHLKKFVRDEIVLKDKQASQFWTYYFNWLWQNRNNNTTINKIINRIATNKSIPEVKYGNLPPGLQIYVSANVSVSVMDIDVTCTDENGLPVQPNPQKVEEIYYRKFLKINQNSATMKAEDIIWGCSSDYNTKSRVLTKNPFFESFFKIMPDAKNNRKLNEILFLLQLSLDSKVKWGSGSKSVASKINDKNYSQQDPTSESSKFIKYLESSFIPCYMNYISSGQLITLPESLAGLGGKATNIKYMLYFLYTTHKLFSANKLPFALYQDRLPSISFIQLINLVSKVISSSVKDKHSTFDIPSDIRDFYNMNQSIFERLNEYRKNNRDKSKELDPLFEELVVNATSHLLPNFSRDLELSLN